MFTFIKTRFLAPAMHRMLLQSNVTSSNKMFAIQDLLGSRCSNTRSTDEVDSLLKTTLHLDRNTQTNTVWLRENCRCNECFNLETQQRNVLFHRLQSKSFEVKSLKEAGEGESMEVLWGDDHLSHYDKDWLRNKLTNINLNFDRTRFLWDNQKIQSYIEDEKIDFESLKHDEASQKKACKDLYEYGFVTIRGVPNNMEGTTEVAEQISTIKETFYGRTWEIKTNIEDATGRNEEMEVKDTAYSDVFLGPHTDGNYFSESPAIIVMQYLKLSIEGGESILVDGFHVANELKRSNPEAYDVLSTCLINFRYKDNKRELSQTSPTFELDRSSGQLHRIRFNHYDRSAHLIQSPSASSSSLYEALFSFSNLVDKSENTIKLTFQPGTVLLIDNWRVFHGRNAFRGHRVLCGCYMERDTWMSNLRMLSN